MVKKTIFLHLPAYREPELIPTIYSALNNAKYPERIRFGICRQYNPEDQFDNLDQFKQDHRFKVRNIHFTEAKGLPYARGIINNELLTDEDYVCQLDAHHRFAPNWDETLILWHTLLVDQGYNPIIGGYLPYYNPFNDPDDRVHEPWLSEAACFYPFGTIFIRPTRLENWQNISQPYPARFLSGHFAFSDNKWAKTIKHDPNIFFAGEELNLTIRSFTSGYDLFHPHRVIIWHGTMRYERKNKLIWDDQSKRGDDMWWKGNDIARARIRQLLRVENNNFDLTGYDIGNIRTINDYEKYSGINFKKRAFQEYTIANKIPPNPIVTDTEWENSFIKSFYYLVNITKDMFPYNDYDAILVAFDDKNGNGINHTYITGQQLSDFMFKHQNIHYEAILNTNEEPKKVVYWGVSKNRGGWVERLEISI